MSRLDRLLVLTGVITPIWFVAIVFIFGALFPGYSHIQDHLSDLGAIDSPVKNLMNVLGFMVTGVLVILFSIGLYRLVSFGWWGKLAVFCLMVFSFLLSALGFYLCDPGCDNFSPMARTHDSLSQIMFVFLMVAFLMFSLDSMPQPDFRKLSRYGFLVAILLAVFGYIDLYVKTPVPGLIQRLMVVVPLAVMELVSLRLLSKSQ